MSITEVNHFGMIQYIRFLLILFQNEHKADLHLQPIVTNGWQPGLNPQLKAEEMQ